MRFILSFSKSGGQYDRSPDYDMYDQFYAPDMIPKAREYKIIIRQTNFSKAFQAFLL